MDWRIKGVIQGVLSRVPGGVALNDALQRAAGGRRDESRHIDIKFEADWLVQMRVLDDLGLRVQGRDLLEIGTGWLPVFPLCFALAGARRCHTFDLHRHLNPAVVPGALRELHWHPGSDEWQYVIAGELSVTLFGSGGRFRTARLGAGDVGYIPRGYGHSIENVGTTPARILIGFNTARYEAIGLSQWLAANPPDVIATNLGLDPETMRRFLARLPRREVFIAPPAGPASPTA